MLTYQIEKSQTVFFLWSVLQGLTLMPCLSICCRVIDSFEFSLLPVRTSKLSHLHITIGSQRWTPGLADFLHVCPAQGHLTHPVQESPPHHWVPVGCPAGRRCWIMTVSQGHHQLTKLIWTNRWADSTAFRLSAQKLPKARNHAWHCRFIHSAHCKVNYHVYQSIKWTITHPWFAVSVLLSVMDASLNMLVKGFCGFFSHRLTPSSSNSAH